MQVCFLAGLCKGEMAATRAGLSQVFSVCSIVQNVTDRYSNLSDIAAVLAGNI